MSDPQIGIRIGLAPIYEYSRAHHVKVKALLVLKHVIGAWVGPRRSQRVHGHINTLMAALVGHVLDYF